MKSIKNIFLSTAAILLRTVSSDTTSYTVSSDQVITFDCPDGGTCCTSKGNFNFPDSSSNSYCQDENGETCCSIGDNFGCNGDSCTVDCSTDCDVLPPDSGSSADGTAATASGDDVSSSSGNTGSGDVAVDSEIGDNVSEGTGDQVTDSNIGTNGGNVNMGTGDVVSDSTIDGEAPPVETESVDAPSGGKVATLAWTMASLAVGAAAYVAM